MNLVPPLQLKAALTVVKAWLRSSSGGMKLPRTTEAIVECFIQRVGERGFTLELVNKESDDSPAWIGYWMFRGCTLEGFKQPVDKANVAQARLLACAALLHNDWCRQRLE